MWTNNGTEGLGLSPAFMDVRVVNGPLEDVPARTGVSQPIRTPCGGHPEQWYFHSRPGEDLQGLVNFNTN
jgi:hypothetical protein